MDAVIISTIQENWRKTVFIIFKVAETFENRGMSLDYEIFGARILELGMRGAIDSQGNLSMWRHSEVRLLFSS